MRYAVMVTRHHDGFAMWDSKYSWENFTSASCGPKADYVKAFTDACHGAGIHTGLYYSPMDWRFPGYFDPKGRPENAALMKEQAYRQIEELCTGFGRVEILWYDGGWLAHQGTDADAAWFWEPVKLNKMVRSHNPKMMVTPRSGYRGDFECDEGPHEAKGGIVPVPWEKCMSLSNAWGYCPDDKYQTSESMIRMLVNVVCRDGNLLLNVGPDPEGRFPKEAVETLDGLGKWMEENGEAVYGTRGGIWQPKDHVYGSTCKGDTVYVHILDGEAFQGMSLPGIDRKIESAELMDGRAVEFAQDPGQVTLRIPEDVIRERRIDTVVRLRTEQGTACGD